MSKGYQFSKVDSYTGYQWCGKALHLITPENRTKKGACKTCREAYDAERLEQRREQRRIAKLTAENGAQVLMDV